MKDPTKDPTVSRRLAIARYAKAHNISLAARKFGCSWSTAKSYLRRFEEYEKTGDISFLQNKPRGNTHRTTPEVEDKIVAIYKESFDPPRPGKRRYSAPKVARLLEERHGIKRHRKTVWSILKRRKVWEPLYSEKKKVERFEKAQPNELWQIDLIEDEPTSFGKVSGVIIEDDYSRNLVELKFFQSKEGKNVLLTTYLAFQENGIPLEILHDGGSQFCPTGKEGESQFQEVMAALGINLRLAERAQIKGKNERLNQFIQRDFLDEVRFKVTNLEELNQQAEVWRRKRNENFVHEGIRATPASRYKPGLKVDPEFLRKVFALEERRKVMREGVISYRGKKFPVPERYIGWNVWVANFFDEKIEIYAGDTLIGCYPL
jgi:transposase